MQAFPAKPVDPLPMVSLQHLIGLRWCSACGMVIAALVGEWVVGRVLFAAPLIAVAAVLASVNVCLHLGVLLDRYGLLRSALFTPLPQLGFDLVGWAAYVYYAGGATNPLSAVFLPLCAIAAVILPPRLAAFFTLVALLLYALLWRFNQPLGLPPGWSAHFSWLGTWIVFSVSTLVLVWFVSRMKEAVLHRETALAHAREVHLRNQWLSCMANLAAGAAHQMSTPLATLQILSDTLIEEHPGQPGLQQDLLLMQAQIAQCKDSLTELTARAGIGRAGERSSMPFPQWMEGLVTAWQSTHPNQDLDWTWAPRLKRARFYPDPELEQIIRTLLFSARPSSGTGHIQHLSARDEGEEVVLEVSLPPPMDAPPSGPLSALSDEMAHRRLRWLGGRTEFRMHSPTLQERRIYIPQAAILWT